MCELQNLFRALDDQTTDAGRLMILGLIADLADDIRHQDAANIRRLYNARWLPKEYISGTLYDCHPIYQCSEVHHDGRQSVQQAMGLDDEQTHQFVRKYYGMDLPEYEVTHTNQRTVRGEFRHVLSALRGIK